MRTVGYVLKRYPRLSETFILQEILGLERLGIKLHLFAIMDPHETIMHSDVNLVQAPVHYLHISPITDAMNMISSHARLFFGAPRRYLHTLTHVLATRQPSWRGLYLALKHFIEAGYLADLALKFQIDHLHAHFANNPTSLARFAQLLTGISFSFTAHAKDIYTADPNRLADKIQYSDFTATCTAYNQQYLNSLVRQRQPATTESKVHLIYHGVNAERFAPRQVSATAMLPKADIKRLQILSIGRLVSKKGHVFLIQGCQLLKQQGYHFHCDIYGIGPLKAELKELINRLYLQDRVSLQGARTQEELVAKYQTADLFVLTPFVMEDGDRDGLPNVLLEAMACGLAVIATNISGIPELITHEETGLLVEPRDARGLASAIERLMLDPALCARIAAAGRRQIVERFAAETNVRNLAALFGFTSTPRVIPSPMLPSHDLVQLNFSQNAEVEN